MSTASNNDLKTRRAKMLVDNFGLRGCLPQELKRVARWHPEPSVRDAAVRAMENRSQANKTKVVRVRRLKPLKKALADVDRKSRAAEKIRDVLAVAMVENMELRDRITLVEDRCDRLVSVVKQMAADAKSVERYLAQIQEAL